MNHGFCKRCNSAVVWIQDKNEKWMRPLEMVEMMLPAASALRLNSTPIYRMQDGKLTQVRLSTLLTYHQCPPSPEEIMATMDLDPQFIETIEIPRPPDDELDYIQDDVVLREQEEREELIRREAIALAEARELARERVAQHHAAEAKKRAMNARISAAITRHGNFIQVGCPRCHSAPGMVCMNTSPNYADGKRDDDPKRYNRSPHPERCDYAWGSGAVEVSPEKREFYTVEHQVKFLQGKQAVDHQKLRYWLGENQDLWAKIRPTSPPPPLPWDEE